MNLDKLRIFSPSALQRLRYTPLILVTALLGALPFLLNPGLFWDDWVWKTKDLEEHLRIGQELGVWWAGYLSYFINSSEHTVLAARLLAFGGWTSAAAAFSITLHRSAIVSRRDALYIFLILCACHVAVIRYIVSMAMANVYMAAFWTACAVLAGPKVTHFWRGTSILLFFISFHLNSLLFLYGLVLIALLWKANQESSPKVTPCSDSSESTIRAMKLRFLAIFQRDRLRSFWQTHPHFILLPVIFLLVIRLPSAVAVALSPKLTNVYLGYNFIDVRDLPENIIELPLSAIRLTAQYIQSLVPTDIRLAAALFVPLWAFYGCMLVTLPRDLSVNSNRKHLKSLAAGTVIIIIGVAPYLLAGKRPDLSDFYESRHALVAIPGIALLLHAFISIFASFGSGRPARFVKLALLSCLLALGTGALFRNGFFLFRDWMQQQAITEYLRTNRSAFSAYKTFIFDDATDFRFGNRTILNYEYTGAIIQAYGGQSHFGISTGEYGELPPNSPLLRQPYLRNRYNISDYNFSEPHLIVRIDSSSRILTAVDELEYGWSYWTKKISLPRPGDFLNFTAAEEYVEIEHRLAQMRSVVDALAAAKGTVGDYPFSATRTVIQTHHRNLPRRILASPYVEYDGVRQLGISFLTSQETMSSEAPDESSGNRSKPANITSSTYRSPRYLYLSNGADYKFLYIDANDFPYAKQAYGAMVDVKRRGYGYWTTGARQW